MTNRHSGPGTAYSAAEYIRANFDPRDRIAILVRNGKRRETLQRISTAERIAASPFQDWMRYKNEKESCDIYGGMNALKPQAYTRTKEDILAIRHLYVDLDEDGSTSLAAIEKSSLVPPPSWVLNTSPDKYQVIWSVEGVAPDQAEPLLHVLAREFGGDRAATDSARVLRLPGFLNQKYEEEFRVAVRSGTGRNYHLSDFRLRADSVGPDDRQPRHTVRKPHFSEPRQVSQSERDWAYVKNALARGKDPNELIRQLAMSRADKSDPEYYARLTVTKALEDVTTSGARASDATPSASEQAREHAGRALDASSTRST